LYRADCAFLRKREVAVINIALNHSPEKQCDDVNKMIDSHIEQVALRISELKKLQRQLKSLRDTCSSRRTVEECGILQNLSACQ